MYAMQAYLLQSAIAPPLSRAGLTHVASDRLFLLALDAAVTLNLEQALEHELAPRRQKA
jgi:hypothetical protein